MRLAPRDWNLLRRGGVIVRHAPVRLNLHIVAASNDLALWQPDGVCLNDLFRQGLWCLCLGEDVGKGELDPLGRRGRRAVR